MKLLFKKQMNDRKVAATHSPECGPVRARILGTRSPPEPRMDWDWVGERWL